MKVYDRELSNPHSDDGADAGPEPHRTSTQRDRALSNCACTGFWLHAIACQVSRHYCRGFTVYCTTKP